MTTILVISQFTVYGDARKGRRPTWEAAAPPRHLRAVLLRVELVNDGPVTLVLDSP
jgi:D-aminoacyl-tRNA deacylase